MADDYTQLKSRSSSKRLNLEKDDGGDQVESNSREKQRKKQRQKKQKDDYDDEEEDDDEVEEDEDEGAGVTIQERKEVLLLLISYRTKKIEHFRKKTAYYQTKMEEAERKLKDLHTKLRCLPSESDPSTEVFTISDLSCPRENGTSVKEEPETTSPQNNVPLPKTQLFIPPFKPNTIPPPPPLLPVNAQVSTFKKEPIFWSSISQVEPPSLDKQKKSSKRQCPLDNKVKPLESDSFIGTSKKKKCNAGNIETLDLTSNIRTSLTCSRRVQTINYLSGQHRRRPRCLQINPSYDHFFCTSGLDGVVNLWELQRDGSDASILHALECNTSKGRWPEDITWHPDGNSLYAAYNAANGEPQVSIINIRASQNKKVTFLEEKPHTKGIINSIEFMPWTDLSFATGGSDHAVILWHEKDDGKFWMPETVHWNLHSSSVNGVCGLKHKRTIISVGSDKRIIGFDLQSAKSDFKYQIESKCMSLLINPVDLNLCLVQAGTPEKQLKLLDIRIKQAEVHSFGWKQESSESLSALVNQSWSSNGFCVSSGSADPMIHIFDIRYTGQIPVLSVKAHNRRVFKAAWHQSLPLLVSISSDVLVGLHKTS